MIVVIPSCRNIELKYLEPLIETGTRFIVVDDTEGTIKVDHPQFSVYNWVDRRKILGRHDDAMPRRNGASRSLGFLIAWWESDADETIVALDDDCVVESPGFEIEVERILAEGVRCVVNGRPGFTNILDLYSSVDSTRVFPRGFPYSERVEYARQEIVPSDPVPVVFNLGLWAGIMDINAVDKIRLQSWTVDLPELRVPNVAIPHGSLACLCSMNMQFKRSVLPAIFQLPMHIEVMPEVVIDRYGDIWGGFILLLLAERRGEFASFGGPMIRHLKEGGFERNLWQEHAAHLVNDEFIAVLRETAANVQPASYVDMIRELTASLEQETPKRSPILRQYFPHLTASLTAWVQLLSR